MAKLKNRPTRLGRGLSSLIGPPIQIDVPVVEPEPAAPTRPRESPPPPEAAGAPAARDAAAAVISPPPQAPPPDAQVGGAESENRPPDQLVYIPVTAIGPSPNQPRRRFDGPSMQRLADSISAQGVMQPVIVRPSRGAVTSAGGPSSGGALPSEYQDPSALTYELVAGERRWRAAELAGLERIPAIIRTLDDRQASQWGLVENLQREDLNPIERAHAFHRLHEQFGLSHDEIAKEVGVERPTISNSIRLIALQESVQQFIIEGHLSAGQAKAIAGLTDHSQQLLLAQRAIKQRMSVRQVEQAARRLTSGAAEAGAEAANGDAHAPSAHLADLEQQIGRQLGTKVRIRLGRKKGTGSILLTFHSLDQFDALMARLGVRTE